jgi:hypothetical protein
MRTGVEYAPEAPLPGQWQFTTKFWLITSKTRRPFLPHTCLLQAKIDGDTMKWLGVVLTGSP